MNAELPYLKRIADALKKISASGIGGTTVIASGGSSSSSVNVGGSVNTAAINEMLETALIATVTEGQTEVQKSVYDVIKDEMTAKLHDALVTTVTEQSVQVEKSIFDLILADIDSM